MGQAPEVWVVGTAGCGKSSLIGSISESSSIATEVTWNIRNKYYTVDVALCEKRAESFVPENELSCEALVLVFKATSEATFTTIKDWYTSKATETTQIKLIVATHTDKLFEGAVPSQREPARLPWIDEAISWSCENGFEYIETAPALPDVDANLVFDGDEQGVRRVSVALQSHAWPNSVLAGTATGKSRETSVAPVEPPVETNRISGIPNASNGHEGSKDRSVASPSLPKAAGESRTVTTSKEEKKAGVEGADRAGGEDEVDSFETLVGQALGARERLAQLPDNARREAAAEFALSFAKLLGDFSDDSNGESDSSDDEE